MSNHTDKFVQEAYIEIYRSKKKLLIMDVDSLHRHIKGMLNSIEFDDTWLYKYHKRSAIESIKDISASRASLLKSMIDIKTV